MDLSLAFICQQGSDEEITPSASSFLPFFTQNSSEEEAILCTVIDLLSLLLGDCLSYDYDDDDCIYFISRVFISLLSILDREQ